MRDEPTLDEQWDAFRRFSNLMSPPNASRENLATHMLAMVIDYSFPPEEGAMLFEYCADIYRNNAQAIMDARERGDQPGPANDGGKDAG